MTETVTPAWIILIASIFTSNILLANFLGMCSFLVCSRQIPTAIGLGTAVTFVMTFTAAINYGIYHGILVPLHIEHLQFIVFIAVIAAFVQFVEMFVERFSPPLYYALGIFLPLITVNCAILGAALFLILRNYTFWQSVAFGFGGGVGWALAIILMAGLRQKMMYSNPPKCFEGVAIVMVITGVMAMAFMGFAGMVAIS
ncbi:MAG: Na(+)-translocating NADH-quinone reductase subunit E [Planctomycetes bacterium ADurb.Bin126]|nr:MAG: Na(+)-translocating NADH-quinone reductase subunit E [Planctomycetes bacterium ADurb.Bin126]HOD83457.1 Rnf-Nqr domain containing protein [Phycisphaerae bacterium]HQL73202.1 Rnf-Nqr domain containing protein [Phycisphaerae bacterium]